MVKPKNIERVDLQQFALAILMVNKHYALQLRDNNPEISCPGMWGLFGGKIEKHEKPENAIVREIKEELDIELKNHKFLWAEKEIDDQSGSVMQFWFFEADITRQWGRHCLLEGQDAKIFSFKELYNLKMPLLIKKNLEYHHNPSIQ